MTFQFDQPQPLSTAGVNVSTAGVHGRVVAVFTSNPLGYAVAFGRGNPQDLDSVGDYMVGFVLDPNNDPRLLAGSLPFFAHNPVAAEQVFVSGQVTRVVPEPATLWLVGMTLRASRPDGGAGSRHSPVRPSAEFVHLASSSCAVCGREDGGACSAV